jgi:hypothetical protein
MDQRSLIAPLLYDCIPKQQCKLQTVANGLAEHSWARDIHGTLGLQRDIAILAALARNRAHGTDGPARQAHLEMERQQYILGTLRLPRHVPGLHNLRGMEANMEGLGTSPSEYLP